jgi:hypothetical protein
MKKKRDIQNDCGSIDFCLRRTSRQTLAITVQPDLSVVVTAPNKATVDAVLTKVRKRAGWIRQQQRYFSGFLPQTPPRRYVSGETHRYLGRQYRLKIIVGAVVDVKMKGRFIYVQTPRKDDSARVRMQVDAWYRERAKERFAHSLVENVTRLGPRLAKVPQIHLRRMSHRWGSWTQLGGIYLNPELVRMPPSCIDYVVTHELCHAIHPNHGREFYALLQRVLPEWEKTKARLEQFAAA